MNKWDNVTKAVSVIRSCKTTEQIDAAYWYFIYSVRPIICKVRKTPHKPVFDSSWDIIIEINDLLCEKRELLIINKIINPIKKEVMYDETGG